MGMENGGKRIQVQGAYWKTDGKKGDNEVEGTKGTWRDGMTTDSLKFRGESVIESMQGCIM